MSATSQCAFQYRLRFFHKCRSPGACDPGQIDRYQIEGSALESTCGSPIIAVLVRYRNDPETGLSRECHRAQFPAGRSPFAVKVVVVPAERVLEYMDQPLLQQPRLVDPQGRNLIGGPDVSADGEIFATPLEANGIAHLNNFCMMVPWSEQSFGHHNHEQQRQRGVGDLGPLSPSGSRGGASGAEDWLSGGSRVTRLSSDGRARSVELCLVVQLLRRGEGQWQGQWFGYDMPHLVSRPFQVVSRRTWVSMHALPSLPVASALPYGQQQQPAYPYQQPPQQQHAVLLQPNSPTQLGALPGPCSPTAGYAFGPSRVGLQPAMSAPAASSLAGPVSGGFGLGGNSMQAPQDFRLVGLGTAGGSVSGGAGFVLGPAGAGPLLMSRTSAGGAAEYHSHHNRRSSASGGAGGSPHGHRGARSRRRSCLSKDCSHDDGSTGAATAAAAAAGGGPARTPSSMSAGDINMCSGTALGAPGDIQMLAASPCSMSSPPSTTAAAPPTLFGSAAAATAGMGEMREGMGGEGGGGGALGLAQAPSAMLLDIQVADMLNGVDVQPFLVEEAMDGEGTPKRVRSNTLAPCVPTGFVSGNSSSNLNTTGAASAGGIPALQHPYPHNPACSPVQTLHASSPGQQQLQLQHPQPQLSRRYPSCSAGGSFVAAAPAGMQAAVGTMGGSGSNTCSGGGMPFVARQSDCSSWSAGNTAEQVELLRKQSTGLSGSANPTTTRLHAFVGVSSCETGGGACSGSGATPVAVCTAHTVTTGATAMASPRGPLPQGAGAGATSQLDSLMAQLLSRPEALQEALERMEEEQQQQQCLGVLEQRQEGSVR